MVQESDDKLCFQRRGQKRQKSKAGKNSETETQTNRIRILMATTTSWSEKDRRDFGRVIRALREIATYTPKGQVVSRIGSDFADVSLGVKQAAIRTWKRENIL